jgi:diaminopimelate decarboxylase
MSTQMLTTAETDCAPQLAPKLAPWMNRLFEQPELAGKWLADHSSPVHVVVASEFKRNVSDLLAPINQRGLQGSLFFARKANKLPWFVTLAGEQGIGVDTASLQELRETIALGVNPQNIVVTAIGKSKQLISEAVNSGCLIVIDNLDELQVLQELVPALGKEARVALRFSGFRTAERIVYSRFGLPVSDAPAVLETFGRGQCLRLEMLHAHIDRYDVQERACAARQLIEIVDLAATQGHKITGIDLGGGILMRYLERERQWKNFLEGLIDSVSGKRPCFTYLQDGLGYSKVGNEVVGKADLYPAYNHLSKERFIAAVLDDTVGGTPLHKEIAARGLKLFFEPGRALLDNVGVTLTEVTFTKRDTLGHLLIGVAMNRMNLRPFRAEFCSDPIFLNTDDREPASSGAFLVGNLCSESDVIFRRKLQVPVLPKVGDAIGFANTAGYLAHHMEIGTHGNPLPANLLVDQETLEVLARA